MDISQLPVVHYRPPIEEEKERRGIDHNNRAWVRLLYNPLPFLQSNLFADLSLPVFIPHQVLISPPPPFPQIHLNRTERTIRSAITSYSESSDLQLLGTICDLLESATSPEDIPLPTLTALFEGLSVRKGSITDIFWKEEDDGLTVNLWGMLSYFDHCRKAFAQEYPQHMTNLERQLQVALHREADLFRLIYYEARKKEQGEHLQWELIEQKIRKAYKFLLPDDPWVQGNLPLLTFPAIRGFNTVSRKKSIPFPLKIASAQEIYQKLNPTRVLQQRVDDSPVVRQLSQVVNELNRSPSIEEREIVRRIPRSPLNQLKKDISCFYELENLRVVGGVLGQIVKEGIPPKIAPQIFLMIREGLKIIVSDQTLNIGLQKSVQHFSSSIRDIRDYFEHPEDYELGYSLGEKPELVKKAFLRNLDYICRNLILPRIEHRLSQSAKHLKRIDELKGLTAKRRPSDPIGKELLAWKKETLNEQFKVLLGFATRIRRRERKERKEGKYQKYQPAFDSSVDYRQFWLQLNPILGELKHLLSGYKNRAQFADRLKTDIQFRLAVQEKIRISCQLLEKYTFQVVRKNPTDPSLLHLERIYTSVRDTRNFQTHDLWRFDLDRLVNTSYLLAHQLPEAIAFISLPCLPHGKDSLPWTLSSSLCQGKLTLAELQSVAPSPEILNSYDSRRRTLLHFLAERKSPQSLKMAKYILNRGANPHASDWAQMGPLHYAAESGFTDLARILITEFGVSADAPSQYGTPYETALRSQEHETARFLRSHAGFQRNTRAKDLLDAVKSLNVEKVRRFQQMGYSAAIEYDGSLPLVTLFEQQYADEGRIMEIAPLLFQAGAYVNQRESTSRRAPLHLAMVNSASRGLVNYLLSLNPRLDLPDVSGDTPLHLAFLVNNEEGASILQQRGASINPRNKEGATPLLVATDRPWGGKATIFRLLQNGADVNASNQYGSVLHHAAERMEEIVVQRLLKEGANPFTWGKSGLYQRKLPEQVASSRRIQMLIREKRFFLESHLLPEG